MSALVIDILRACRKWSGLVALVLLVQVSSLQTAAADVVVAGFRPTETVRYTGVKANRLADAAKGREFITEIVKAVANQPVIGHDELTAIDKKYFTKIIGCKGETKCIAGVLGPVKDKATLAVYGD